MVNPAFVQRMSNREFNKNSLGHNFNDLEEHLVKTHNSNNAITITIPLITRVKHNTIVKDFTNGIDDDFQRRPSQLSDDHFKTMTKLIVVKDNNNLTGHFIPGLADAVKVDTPRTFEKPRQKNDFGFLPESIRAKPRNYVRVAPNDVVPAILPNNRFNDSKFSVQDRTGEPPSSTDTVILDSKPRSKIVRL